MRICKYCGSSNNVSIKLVCQECKTKHSRIGVGLRLPKEIHEQIIQWSALKRVSVQSVYDKVIEFGMKEYERREINNAI